MKITLLLVAIMLSSFLGFGQISVKGRVLDKNDGQGLPGVNIVIKGTSQGTVSDIEGGYSLEAVAENAVLVISYVGYVTQEVTVSGKTNYNIELVSDVKSLEEVVVIGYGTSTVKELTGAISRVSGKDIEARNPVRLDQALQGQTAGVQISTASGSPGGSSNIRIRGLGSNGNNNPLILVDGIIYSVEGLNALNPSDIESVNVLKDASASIYGVLAGNGVIVVTTKQGKKGGKPSIEFSGYVGIQETTKKLDLLNARQYAVLKNEMFGSAGQAVPFLNPDLGNGTDWQDAVFQRAPMQNYNLNLTGGTDKSSYSIGGSYLSQKGIVGGDKASFERYNVRINFSTEITSKIKLQSILLFTNEYRKTLPESGLGSVLYNTINASPAASIRQPDGSFTKLNEFLDVINPLAQMENTYNWNKANKFVGKEEVSYNINSNFDLTGRFGYDYSNFPSKTFNPIVDYGLNKPQNATFSSVQQTEQTSFSYNVDFYLNYNRTFNELHKVKGTAGFVRSQNYYKGLFTTGFDIPNNSWEFADISLANLTGLKNGGVGSGEVQSRLQSVFIRGEYAYKEKYLFSALARRDVSSKFGRDNISGYFPAVSAAWVASSESFFKTDFIQFMKVRASYGVAGSDRIGEFRYRAFLGGEGVYPFGDQLINGVAIGRAGNSSLRWEKNIQTNIGIDLTTLKGKLDVSIDYFIKKTSDLLFEPETSALLGTYGAGGAPPIINGGDVKNTGVELQLNYTNQVTSDFSFNVNFNATKIKNEVTRTPMGVDFISYGSFGVGGERATRFQRGLPLGAFYGFKTEGVYQTAQEVTERGINQQNASRGDLRYVDQDGNKTINFGDNSDKVFLGSAIPDVILGLNTGAKYKGIDFSVSLYSSIGNSILRNFERQAPLANMLAYRIGRWTGEGSTNENPRLTNGETRNNVYSDYFVEDASYLRVRNIQLGYLLPASLINKIGAKKLRFYIAVNNLATFTKYRGFDPDFNSGDALLGGVDFGAYPQARTYMVGFNLNF
jgi:TonB-linked SusC/RagA family outer membrane protein